MTHLLVRKDHVLCTRCFRTEPVHCGNGTPMDTLIMAYKAVVSRHKRCVVLPKEALRKFKGGRR